MLQRIATALAVLVVTGASYGVDVTVIHVNASTTGANDGSSWQDAFTDLHDALTKADALGGAGVQIWVAAGDYVPGPADADPQSMYVLVSGTAMYGGFAGWETELDQRDWGTNETILRREWPGPSVQETTPILYCDGLAEGSMIDGFIVRDGFSWDGPVGGMAGMALVDSSLHIANSRFVNNRTSVEGGGAIDGNRVALTIVNCQFIENRSGVISGFGGGAIRLVDSIVTVKDSEFIKNRAGGGGAISATSSDVKIEHCAFHENVGVFSRSGIEAGLCNVEIVATTFKNNGYYPLSVGGLGTLHVVDTTFESNGGGIEIGTNTAATILRCTIIDNDSSLEGGGLYFIGQTLDIRDSVFRGNTSAFQGGNAFIATDEALLVDCEFTEGHVDGQHGGLYVPSGNLTAINCLFARNSRGGIGVGFANTTGASVTLINCTIIDNHWFPPGYPAAGLYVEPGISAVVMNSIIWGNRPHWNPPGSCEGHCGGQAPAGCWCDEDCCQWHDCCDDKAEQCGGCQPVPSESNQIVGLADVSHSIVQGLDPFGPYAGPAVNGDDPLFVDADGRLSASSPAIDAGDNAYLPPKIVFDLDGNPRIVDGSGDGRAIVDMGAFEIQPQVFADLNGDGVVDHHDLLILLVAWGPCPTGGTPMPPSMSPHCPADLNGDGVVDVTDLLNLLANWG